MKNLMTNTVLEEQLMCAKAKINSLQKQSSDTLKYIVDSRINLGMLLSNGSAYYTAGIRLSFEYWISITVYPSIKEAQLLRDNGIPFKFYLDFTKTARYKKMGLVYLEDLGYSFNECMSYVDHMSDNNYARIVPCNGQFHQI